MPADKTRLKIIIVLSAVAALIAMGRLLHLNEAAGRALSWVSSLGAWGPVAYAIAYVLACVLLVPGSVLTLGAGALFGVAEGTAVVLVSATAGATCSFLIGRHIARGWVERKLSGDPRFAALDSAVAREGWKVVGLTRLSPLFPFVLLNYAYGLTGVRLRDYFLATLVGMLPGTLMYVYIGSLAAGVAGLGGAGQARTPLEWALYGLGLAATAAVAVIVGRMAKSALKEKTGSDI